MLNARAATCRGQSSSGYVPVPRRMSLYQIILIIRHFNHTHYLTPDQYLTSLFGPDPLPSISSWKLSFSTSMLQHFTAESSQELRRNAVTEASVNVPYPPLQIVNSFSLYLYPLSAPFLNPLSSPSPPSLLSLLINSLSS